MDKIISQIEKIRKINNQNKLVIFVGAGVSRNSGVCSWWELVRDIAIKIGYDDICEKCAIKYEYYSECGEGYEFCSSNSKCHMKHNFSAEEFLKIPQYFYDTKGKDEYYNFLKKKFCRSYDSNVIDELIVELNPEHIITTNYDHLIEDVKHPNVSNYTVIECDGDLLEKNGHRYIIKMHGDIDKLEEIVLKEDDYLKYSQNHTLIETYIKSLLVDKTFLFIGYSLNDNNLSLIMSYIDYFVKDKGVKGRTPHYLVVNSISKPERETLYWGNKGIELINLSDINKDMKGATKCDSLKSEQGQSLYTFLKYVYNDKLPYFNDKKTALQKSLLNILSQFESFNFVSYTDFINACGFSHRVNVINSALNFMDVSEYNLIKSIFQEQNATSNKIKRSFTKTGLCAIQCSANSDFYEIEENCYAEDVLFERSLKNQYSEILDVVNKNTNQVEKAYYYSLIYRMNVELMECMKEIEEQIKNFDYHSLTIEQKIIIAIYEFNTISLRILNFNFDNEELWKELLAFLDSAAIQSTTFETIKKMNGTNGDVLSTLNNSLTKHEEYYMKKSTTAKLGGTIFGDLFDLQSIVYDYYKFYKKNYLMIDWFNNVEKICEPYIKAMLCTYYPDEYQFSNNEMGRTQVEPYPINLIDIDMIVKHTKFKNFNSWISHYKVFKIQIDVSVDIVEIFENFCVSMRNFWNMYVDEHLKVFSKLISLVELTSDQKHRILKAYITLIESDEIIDIGTLQNRLDAIWIYVQRHYDKSDSLYGRLLTLMVNNQLIKDTLDDTNAYEKLIEKLSDFADQNIYNACVNIIDESKDKYEKSRFAFVLRSILLKFDNDCWKTWIENSISGNSIREIYTYIISGVIIFNGRIKDIFDNKLTEYKKNKVVGLYTYPDHQKDTIEVLLVLLLTEHIPALEDVDFLKKYTEDSDYLEFLFDPDSFDYSKITTADYMWCNFINNDKYRETILKHKSEFWSKDDEKRIRLGFGSNFENRVVYKYLFD